MFWLLGTGYMGQEYAKVLKEMKQDFLVIGRNEEKAKKFAQDFGVSAQGGGADFALKNNPLPKHAIVAVDADQLFCVAEALLKAGVKSILLEKPAGLNESEISQLSRLARDQNATVQIAYNRRFYSSTLKAKELIAQDGGVTSFHFEFTEWSRKIEPLSKSKAIFDAWLLANSTHVIDLAFYLGGKPTDMKCFSRGKNVLKWHPKASSFAGSGVSEKGALFSYMANWDAPGRWSVEILTRENRYYFKPMESLQVQRIDTVKVDPVIIDDHLDTAFKPGLFKQMEAFQSGKNEGLKDIHEQLKDSALYQQILEGN